MFNRILYRLWFPVLIVCFIYFGVLHWAFHPLFSPPQGIYPISWTDADLIRDRYPIRLIDPRCLANSHDWIYAECRTRLGLIALVTAAIFAINNFRKHKRPSA
jgi:hypothetical protein